MEQEEFEFCEFVEWNMCFVTYTDFCKKCSLIKKMYQDLDKNQKRFYKWYVYANLLIDVSNGQKETYKNAIWEYLNAQTKEEMLELFRLRASLKH